MIIIFGAYIGLGSNLFNRKNNILQALDEMRKSSIEILLISNLYETDPYGVEDQPSFLNAVAGTLSSFQPCELLRVLKKIETKLGRETTVHWGPRIIDLDILLFGEIVIEDEVLSIPHKDFRNRDFVLKPLMDIGRMIIDPVTGKTVEELYFELPKDSCREISW